jgi:hypothetical protein
MGSISVIAGFYHIALVIAYSQGGVYIVLMPTKMHKASLNHFPPMPDILETVTGWIPPNQPSAAPASILADAAFRFLNDIEDSESRRECLQWIYDATTLLMSRGEYPASPPPRQIIPSVVYVQDYFPALRPRGKGRKRRGKPKR